mmetsp:Transcript_37313/g.72859  ORF Transcript_37313/g.72859 Transcript_37313/m.72859 type:complete len:223 (+) Transcript_37313:541-1209(+)
MVEAHSAVDLTRGWYLNDSVLKDHLILVHNLVVVYHPFNGHLHYSVHHPVKGHRHLFDNNLLHLNRDLAGHVHVNRHLSGHNLLHNFVDIHGNLLVHNLVYNVRHLLLDNLLHRHLLQHHTLNILLDHHLHRHRHLPVLYLLNRLRYLLDDFTRHLNQHISVRNAIHRYLHVPVNELLHGYLQHTVDWHSNINLLEPYVDRPRRRRGFLLGGSRSGHRGGGV